MKIITNVMIIAVTKPCVASETRPMRIVETSAPKYGIV